MLAGALGEKPLSIVPLRNALYASWLGLRSIAVASSTSCSTASASCEPSLVTNQGSVWMASIMPAQHRRRALELAAIGERAGLGAHLVAAGAQDLGPRRRVDGPRGRAGAAVRVAGDGIADVDGEPRLEG